MVSIIIFSIIALSIFIFTVVNLIKKNNSNYFYALIPEFIGIIINFICIFFRLEPNTILLVIMYTLSVIIPIIILILEKNEINLSELIGIAKANYYEYKNQYDLVKKQLLKNVDQFPNYYLS